MSHRIRPALLAAGLAAFWHLPGFPAEVRLKFDSFVPLVGD